MAAAKEPRKARTEEERARDLLGIAQRKVAKLQAVVKTHEKGLRDAKADLEDAQRLLAYRADHPALPTTNPNTGATASGGNLEESTES